jgi:glycosyltransferase involved in cell wall biosynthesis
VIRLAVISTDPGVGWGSGKGASVHLREICGALVAEGAAVLALVAGEVRRGDIAPPGVRVEALPAGRTAAERLRSDAGTGQRIARRLREFRAAAVYERFALHSAAGAWAAREAGLPHLVELNAPLLEEAARYRRLERPLEAARIERAVLASATVVFAVSRPLAEYAGSHGARRVEVLPNGVDASRFPRPSGQRGDPPTAVLVARARPWHGVGAVAEAWRMLDSAAPRLIVLGDPGEERQELAAVGAELTGPVDHALVPATLCAADIGLAPYAAGAPAYFSPLKLFEYMAAGLAVVAGDLPGVRDAVGEDGAVLVPPGDTAALSAAVRALTGDRELRLALGRAARARVLSEHTWPQRARRVLAAASETIGVPA